MEILNKEEAYQKNIQFIQNLAKNGPKKKTLKKHFSFSDFKNKKKTQKKSFRSEGNEEKKKDKKISLTLKILSNIMKLSDHQIKKQLIQKEGSYFYKIYQKNTQIKKGSKNIKKSTINNLVQTIKRVAKEELGHMKKTSKINSKNYIEQKIQNIINNQFEGKQKIKKKKQYKIKQDKYFQAKAKLLCQENKHLKIDDINTGGDGNITSIGSLGLLPEEIKDILENVNYQYFRYGSIGDGGCLFHSFLEAINPEYYKLDGNNILGLFQKQKMSRSLRKYMAKNVNQHFMEYFSIDGLFNKQTYIQHLLNIGEYGENDDITFFSGLKNVNVFIFQSGVDDNGNSISPIAINNFQFDINLPSIFIYNMNQHHYEPIIRLTKMDLKQPNFNKENLSDHILIPAADPINLVIAQKYFNNYNNTGKLLRNWNIIPTNYYQRLLASIDQIKKNYTTEKEKDSNSLKCRQLKSILKEALKKEESITKYSDCYTNSNGKHQPNRLGFCNDGKFLFTIPDSEDTCCSNIKETQGAYIAKQRVLKEKLTIPHQELAGLDFKKYFKKKNKKKNVNFKSIYPKVKDFCNSSQLEIEDIEIKDLVKLKLLDKSLKGMSIDSIVQNIIESIIEYIMKNQQGNSNNLNTKKKVISFFKTLSEFDRKNIADEDSGGGFSKEQIEIKTKSGKKMVDVLIGLSLKMIENDETEEIKFVSGIDVRSLYYNIIDDDGDDDWTRIGLVFYEDSEQQSCEIIEKGIIN
jgi:hypothetical protein